MGQRPITCKHILHLSKPTPLPLWPNSPTAFTIIVLSFSLSDGAPEEQGVCHSSSDQQ